MSRDNLVPIRFPSPISGEVDAKRPEGAFRTVLFPIDILDRLMAPAMKRGLHPNALARLIVETVIDDGMIDAVLDDVDGRR